MTKLIASTFGGTLLTLADIKAVRLGNSKAYIDTVDGTTISVALRSAVEYGNFMHEMADLGFMKFTKIAYEEHIDD